MPLSLQQLSGGYDQQTIVENIDLTIEPGEWLTLLGANGSGKSTLLKLCSRILSPQAGQVILDGKAIHQQPAKAVARRLAMLPQQQQAPSGLTVEQLVMMGRSPHQAWWQWELDTAGLVQVDRAIAWTELEDYRDRLVSELSGGERQRAFLALALAQNPTVLLLDEPTTFLDIHYQLQLLELLKQLNRDQGLTIVAVLHEVNLAARYSDRLAFLKQGQLYDVGPPEAVLTPKHLRDVFEVEVALIDTPVGRQVCPLTSVHPEPEQSEADAGSGDAASLEQSESFVGSS